MAGYDDIAYASGPMIPPDTLRDLFFPWLHEAAAMCHARGRPLLFHSDGKLDRLLPDIIAAGVDALLVCDPRADP